MERKRAVNKRFVVPNLSKGRFVTYEVTSQDSELLDRAAQFPSERSVGSAR